MGKNQHVIRIPKDLIPLWESIKLDLSRELKTSNDIGQQKPVKDSITIQKVLMEFSRRDYYLMKESIGELNETVNTLQSKIDQLASQLMTITVKLTQLTQLGSV